MSPPARRRSSARRTPARRSQRRPEKSTLLIVCEGKETEPNYFVGLKQFEAVRHQFAITVKRGRGGSRLQIVRQAVDLANRPIHDFDDTWCVMDVERLDNEQSRRDLNDAIALAQRHGIKLSLSNPAFEVWFLAHFDRTSRGFNDSDAVIVELNGFWTSTFRCAYSKTDQRIFDRLATRTQTAIQHAKAVLNRDHGDAAGVAQCNSSTDVFKLVEHLWHDETRATT